MKRVYCLLFLVFCLTSFSIGQDNRPHGMMEADLPHFFLDILNFASDSVGVSRVDVYVQVPHEMLSFVKSDNLFRSRYEVTIDVLDKEGNLVNEKLWTEELSTEDYKESVSPTTGKTSQKTFYLKPASYEFVVQIRDVETRKLNQVKRAIKVRDFSENLTLSDVMVVKQLNQEGEKTVVIPNIAATIGSAPEMIPFFFEVRSKTLPLEAKFILTLSSKIGVVVRTDTLKKLLTKSKQSCFMNISSNALLAGEYTLDVKAYVPDSSDSSKMKEMSSVSRSLRVRIQGLPVSVNDIDHAIDQLQYVAEKEVIEEMKAAVAERKRDLFIEFWKKRDPTKETEVNELMLEYYQRVEFANKNFSHYQEGWKTDRGNVYIVFGEPNNIERHPFDIDSKPYEIWTYFEMNREFVFVDETGFGDYRLRNPIWDTWRTRYR
ncbi:MAG: GWxTD domain-containing protein [Ignavibacteriae bacterium]|nr:GWxTD domain-containing protein [Ignavibacteriota bacterium]